MFCNSFNRGWDIYIFMFCPTNISFEINPKSKINYFKRNSLVKCLVMVLVTLNILK